MVTHSLAYLLTYSCYSLTFIRFRLAKTKSYRYAVIGPDWPCVLLTYVVIIVPSIFVYLYLVRHTIYVLIRLVTRSRFLIPAGIHHC